MSITAQLEPVPPIAVIEPPDKWMAISPGNMEITSVYERAEPIYGSFKLQSFNGQVCAKHTNGGGLVSLTARVDHSVFVAEGAAVLDRASVRDHVRVEDHAVVEGDAVVTGTARIRHESRVGEWAVLEGRILMTRHASVAGNAHLRGMISMDYYAFVGDESQLFGNMHLE